MNVLDYVKTLKKAVKGETNTFAALLEKANEKEFQEKETILSHFNTVILKENGSYLHLMYNKQLMHKLAWDPFYIQTRALVLDWKKEEFVLYPFDKFFELNEHTSSTEKEVYRRLQEGAIMEVTEKIDGSLIVARFYNNDFFVVTTGSFDGLHVKIAKRILSEDIPLQNMIKHYPNHTFMLEMKNAEFPQLIKYGEDKLTIIGMRDMETYHELTRTEIAQRAEGFGANVAPLYHLSIEEMIAIMENPTTTNNEGYILRIDDFLVKMKTKNFILANRFAGDPSRNFNMIMQCIQEGRVEAVRPMIKKEYVEAFDEFLNYITRYKQTKRANLERLFATLPQDDNLSHFGGEAKRLYPEFAKDLMAMKRNMYQDLTKKDVKKLKPAAQYFTCVAHYKYAEFNELDVKEIEAKIESGEIRYVKKFVNDVNKQTVYLLPKWQWLNEEIQS